MASSSRLDQIVEEVRAALADLMVSNESGSVTVHCSKTNGLRKEINRTGENIQLTAEEMTQLRRTYQRPPERRAPIR